MRKAQMFIVTAIFLSSTLFVLQQALVTYASLDSTKPFRTKEIYLLKDITDSVETTIKAGGNNPATDCARFQINIEELMSLIKDDVSSQGYMFVYEYDVDCSRWNNMPTSGNAPFRLSVRLSETYDATGILEFYHLNDADPCAGLDCDDGNACTADSCIGGVCHNADITSCTDGDSCCPPGCTIIDDDDCPGADPCAVMDCDDGNACTADSCIGGVCHNTALAPCSCIDGDSCCPPGCTVFDDSDCMSDPSADVTWKADLVSWWMFDCNARDYEVGNNHGTVSGAALMPSSGRFGGAYEFDGVDDYIDVGDFSISGDGLTLAAWVTMDAFGLDPRIISKSPDTEIQSHSFLLGLDEVDNSTDETYIRMRVRTEGYTTTLVSSTPISAPRSWTHLAAVYDGSDMIIYMDGEEVVRTEKTGDIESNIGEIVWIGNNHPGTGIDARPWDGMIDEVMVFSRGLNAAEIQELYDRDLAAYKYVTACNGDWEDCDGDPANGCETDTGTDGGNCGGCGNACGSGYACVGGTCQEPWMSGLVSWWKLDGDATDSIGTNHGTPMNGVAASATGCASGSCYIFDGVNDHISIPLDFETFPADATTISLWARPIGNQSAKGVFSWAGALTSATPFVLLQRYNSTYARWYVNGSYIAPYTPANDDSMYHLAITWNGTNWAHYINGNFVGSVNRGGRFSATGNTIYLGNGHNGYFNGTIDEVMVWDRALTPAEVASVNNSFSVGTCSEGTGDCTSSPGCETDTLTNASHCGWCNNACGTGSTCVGGTCQTAPWMSGLISWWKLDGDATDSAGDNDGTVDGATPTGTGCISGGCYSFDGTNDKIDVGVIPIPGNEGSISLWLKEGGAEQYRCAIGRYWTQHSIGKWGNSPHFTGSWETDGEAWGGIESDVEVDGEWHHIVLTYDGGLGSDNLKMYVDGGLSASKYLSGDNEGNDEPWQIGTHGNDYEFWLGSIDEVMMWDRALSAAEVQAMSYYFRPSLPTWATGLVSWWKFDADTEDSVGSNTGTASGATYTTSNCKSTGCYIIDGVDDYIYTSENQADPQDFSLSAWFRTTTAGGYKIIGFEDSRTGESSISWDRALYVGTDGLVYFGTYDGNSASTVYSSTAVDDGSWHHAVGVRSDAADMIYLYVDGQLQDSMGSLNAEHYDGYWRIGAYANDYWTNGHNGYFPGAVDEVMIWDRALSSTEVQSLFNYGYT